MKVQFYKRYTCYVENILLTLNSLAAGAVHIRFLYFLLAHPISAFKHVKDKNTLISKIRNLLTSILSNMNNFHPLEVVASVSETQLQAGENCN